MSRKTIPDDRLIELQKRLEMLSPRSPERIKLVTAFGELYGVSIYSVYRALRSRTLPKGMRRVDAGKSRVLPTTELERYCEIIAACKMKTNNLQNHSLPTSEIIRILEETGFEINGEITKAPRGVLKKTTVNRYLKKWGLNLRALSIEPVVTRFEAKHSNECWHFDLSPSDLKTLEEWPEWISKKDGRPLLMLYSVVDDRSGVAYQEYHVVYGEDVEAALKFLYKVMSPKNIEGFPFQGIPAMIYMDNGPIGKSRIFQRVMTLLGVELKFHMPKGKDGRRTTSRSKGKVERPFRTVKEVHETLYHFHKPKDDQEANQWLINYILRYNEKDHRKEPHSRIADWIKKHPASGIRTMCSWERFCAFAREPERKKVGPDARVSVNGCVYQVSPELAGKWAILWWGMFDNDIYLECDNERYGPYHCDNGTIPLNRYRSYKKTKDELRADAIEKLANALSLPKEALTVDTRSAYALRRRLPDHTPMVEFIEPDPFQEFTFQNKLHARKTISDYLGVPLSTLPPDDIEVVDTILAETMKKKDVMEKIRDHFRPHRKERKNAD